MKYAVLLAALLSGCANWPKPTERIVTVEVKVPVVTPIPKVKKPVRPELMIYQLRPEDQNNPGKVVQYYQASIKQLQGYAIEMETIIDGYIQAAVEQEKNQ